MSYQKLNKLRKYIFSQLLKILIAYKIRGFQALS
jgi:hypothetical protein